MEPADVSATATEGAKCPSCGTWFAARRLSCACGFRPLHEALRGLASGLVTWVVVLVSAILVWAPLFSLLILPLFVVALSAAAYGVRSSLLAMRGTSRDKALGALALVINGAFFVAPVVLFFARRR